MSSKNTNFEISSIQKNNNSNNNNENDALHITALGAGNEVGRSCLVIQYKGKTVMVYH